MNYKEYMKNKKNNVVPCFLSGSMVETNVGKVPVENIRPGDMVLTRDNSYKEVVWSGKKDANEPAVYFGGSMFSMNHRVLYRKGSDEFLVPSKFLAILGLAKLLETTTRTFVHFMMDNHEIVMVDDVWSETLNVGPYLYANMHLDQKQEITELFPELEMGVHQGYARRVLKKSELDILR